VVEALKLRAARHGLSAEAEHRELLRAALSNRTATSLKERLLRERFDGYAAYARGTKALIPFIL
jgi:plasmid stability protein